MFILNCCGLDDLFTSRSSLLFQVASNETCYAIGILIEKEKSSKADVEEIRQTMKQAGFKSIEIPFVEKAMCTVFPFKANFLCILVAVAKVYPALRAYVKVGSIFSKLIIEC